MPLVYFITLSRSDYTTTRPVVKAALQDAALKVKLIAGGSHLLARFGHTLKAIEQDGLEIEETADFLRESDDSAEELAAAYARAVTLFVEIFQKGKPDYVFVVGDRWEMLAAVSAAAMLHIPIVHHSGGDITQGSADNQHRYAMTALAHLHLVALEEHKQRLLAMGEEEWRVVTTGEPALTELKELTKSVPDIYQKLRLAKDTPFVLATFHPTSFDAVPMEQQIEIFLAALDAVEQEIILTAPNPDAGSGAFFTRLKAYAKEHPKVHFHESLGTEAYYTAMQMAEYMLGNSSSGLWEAPSFGLPVIDLGQRQQGRICGENVLQVPLEIKAIHKAIKEVQTPAFKKKAAKTTNPYVMPDTLERILSCLKQPYDREKLLAKKLVDPLIVSRVQ